MFHFLESYVSFSGVICHYDFFQDMSSFSSTMDIVTEKRPRDEDDKIASLITKKKRRLEEHAIDKKKFLDEIADEVEILEADIEDAVRLQGDSWELPIAVINHFGSRLSDPRQCRFETVDKRSRWGLAFTLDKINYVFSMEEGYYDGVKVWRTGQHMDSHPYEDEATIRERYNAWDSVGKLIGAFGAYPPTFESFDYMWGLLCGLNGRKINDAVKSNYEACLVASLVIVKQKPPVSRGLGNIDMWLEERVKERFDYEFSEIM